MKAKNVIFIMIVAIALLLIMVPNVQGMSWEQALDKTYTPPDVGGAGETGMSKLVKIIGIVIAGLRNLSIVVTVVVITILGVKYMIGSVEQKADYKKDFPNIIIGVVVIAGVFSIISMIFSAVGQIA